MVCWHRLSLALGFAFGVGSPHHASAQAAHRWSSDVTVGGAIVDGGDFLNHSKAAAHLSLAGRIRQRERFAVYVEADYDWLGRFGLLGTNPDLVCVVDHPGGGCRPSYPDVAGPSASIGLLFAPVNGVEARVGVGGASYTIDGTRVGAGVGQLDAAVFPAPHVGLILGARLGVVPRYRHDRLTMVPVLLGLRLR
jgi:hypothetical protein